MSTRRLCGREQPQACAADDDVAPHLPLLAPPPRLLPDARPPARPGALLKAGADPLARNAAGQMPLHAAAEAGEVAALHDLLRGAVRAWAPAAGAAAAGERRRAGRGASTGAAELRSAMPAAAEAGRRLPGPRLRGLRELSADAAGRTPLHAAAASLHRAPPGQPCPPFSWPCLALAGRACRRKLALRAACKSERSWFWITALLRYSAAGHAGARGGRSWEGRRRGCRLAACRPGSCGLAPSGRALPGPAGGEDVAAAAELLMACGFDHAARDAQGASPLHVCRTGAAAAALLRAGAAAGARCRAGAAPLHWAANAGATCGPCALSRAQGPSPAARRTCGCRRTCMWHEPVQPSQSVRFGVRVLP